MNFGWQHECNSVCSSPWPAFSCHCLGLSLADPAAVGPWPCCPARAGWAELCCVLQMPHSGGPRPATRTMLSARRSRGGTMTWCPTSTTRHPPRHTWAPRAAAAATRCPQARWNPQNPWVPPCLLHSAGPCALRGVVGFARVLVGRTGVS